MELLEQLRAALAGRYAVERELGHGGMAMVFLAQDLKQRRPVAIKVFRPELAAALGVERFLREIEIAARLTHPHILPLHESGDADGVLFYVMPYIEGESLRDRLTRQKQLPVEEAVEITRQVAAALSYAHSRDVVHRDIKPENILLQGDEVIVADFGIARAITAAGGEKLTQTGIAVGTPAYMSPEQAMAEPALDGRSDVYSLGCVLYEMLAGEPPYTGSTAQAILARRLTDPVPPLRTVRDSVPLAVEQAITKALAKTPADRFATATQFAEAVRQQPTPPGIARASVRKPPVRWIAGAVGLLIVMVLTWRLWPTAKPRSLNPELLAVAPFDVHGASLASWSEGLMEYLSRSLDGAGALQTVSPSLFLRRWNGRADRASAEWLGRQTQAGLVVFGSLLQGGRDSIRLHAALLDVAAGRVLAEVEVPGDTLAMDRAADSLAVALLQGLGRTRPVGAVRNAPFSSAPLAAIKEFLQGERFYRLSQYDSALAHHAQAVALDSNFALAYHRMLLDLGWRPPTSEAFESPEAYAFKAASLNHGLAMRDSLLIAADSYFMAIPSSSDPDPLHDRLLATLRNAAHRFPSDPEVWMALGEAYEHQGGATDRETLEAFDKAIALDSGFAPAYEHVLQLAFKVGGEDLALRHARAYLASIPVEVSDPSIRLAAQLLDPARSHSPEVARIIDTIGVRALWRVAFEHLGDRVDSAETSIRLLKQVPRGRRSVVGLDDWVADTLMWPQYLADALLYRGRAREAYDVFRPLIVRPNTNPWTWFANPLRDLVLWPAFPPDTAAAVVAGPLQPRASGHAPSLDWLRPPHWLSWWFAHADTIALRGVIAQNDRGAGRSTSPLALARARYLRQAAAAYLALIRADSATALREFEALPDSVCAWVGCAMEKLTLARLLESRGDDRRAQAILDRSFSGPLLSIFARLERARIAERLGDRETATREYQFVADAWRNADPELQPYVAEAREGLRRLKGTPG